MAETTDDLGAFDLLDWIESGTVARRTVTIYNDPALASEYEALAARLAEAEAAESDDTERTMDEAPESVAILAQIEALWERWQASKSTWTVRALSGDEARAIVDRHPVPDAPAKPLDTAPAAEKAAHAAAVKAWLRESDRVSAERNLEFIATAVVEVTTNRGTVHHVNVDTLRRMRSRPHGHHRIEQLVTAVNEATQGDVEIPRPTSPGNSGSDRA